MNPTEQIIHDAKWDAKLERMSSCNHDIYCNGCGARVHLHSHKLDEKKCADMNDSKGAYGAGYRLSRGFGWLCMDCQRAVLSTEIRGDIHAETGS